MNFRLSNNTHADAARLLGLHDRLRPTERFQGVASLAGIMGDPKNFIAIAEEGDDVIGAMVCRISWGVALTFPETVVPESRRGLGIEEGLLLFALQQAKDKGAVRSIVGCNDANSYMKRAFEACGFKTLAIREEPNHRSMIQALQQAGIPLPNADDNDDEVSAAKSYVLGIDLQPEETVFEKLLELAKKIKESKSKTTKATRGVPLAAIFAGGL